MMPIKTVIHGAAGKVGQVLINDLAKSSEVKLVGAVDVKVGSPEIGLGDGSRVPFSDNLDKIIITTRPEVMVDFSIAGASMAALRIAVGHKVNAVIGTTGFTSENLAEMKKLADSNNICILQAPNFALGAVLMIQFARVAAKYLDYAEIIELHHDQKVDAPSGTALNTARAMMAARQKPFLQTVDADRNYASRGQKTEGIPIHSVRLPGLMAHQEVIFGGLGQTLIIRHDTINRECYVPGVLLGIQAVVKRKGLIQGLENVMDL
jgi:4-hydroxy-tetrahydrodipicolinate reductase